VKLLRVLETKSFERLGGTEVVDVDIRLITATNRNLESKVKEGSFREDLYYRLNVIPLDMPPLRERKDDILLLVDYFIKKYSVRSGKSIKGITAQAKDIIMSHSWPGNVRELENAVERAIVLSRSELIDADSLLAFKPIDSDQKMSTDNLNLAELEKQAIAEALRRTQGNQIEAAALLGIHRNTIRNKMKQYGLDG